MTHPKALVAHLESWVGAWPPATGGITIVGAESRIRPEWDGRIRPVRGIRTPFGTVIGVPPGSESVVKATGDTVEEIIDRLPAALGHDGWRVYEGVFRWSDTPKVYDAPGSWHSPDEPGLPAWLQPFNAPVLVGFAGDEVAAGVGRKVHDPYGQELAVVTEEAHRGHGWAKRLVSQAAIQVLDEGAIPTYLHAPGNDASARTAEATGFPDRGWTILGMYPAAPG